MGPARPRALGVALLSPPGQARAAETQTERSNIDLRVKNKNWISQMGGIMTVDLCSWAIIPPICETQFLFLGIPNTQIDIASFNLGICRPHLAGRAYGLPEGPGPGRAHLSRTKNIRYRDSLNGQCGDLVGALL
jgi:hypothetical protein